MSKKLKRKTPKKVKLTAAALKRRLANLRPHGPFTPEESSRGGKATALRRQRAMDLLEAQERGEILRVGGKTPDGTPCPLLEKNQRRIREEDGLPEPTYIVIPPPELEPQLQELQKMDYERRVRLLSDD